MSDDDLWLLRGWFDSSFHIEHRADTWSCCCQGRKQSQSTTLPTMITNQVTHSNHGVFFLWRQLPLKCNIWVEIFIFIVLSGGVECDDYVRWWCSSIMLWYKHCSTPDTDANIVTFSDNNKQDLACKDRAVNEKKGDIAFK